MITPIRTISLFHKRISPAWKVCLVTFLAGRILFSIWGAIIWAMRLIPMYKGKFYFDITPILQGIPGALIGVWQRWDGIHYQRIVMYGYEDAGLTAFFPLYPILGRIVSIITGLHPVIALIIVSNLAFLISLRIFYQLIGEIYTQDLARETLFCIIIFPTSIFFYSIYPQSLLLLFILLAYWMARKGRWVEAGLAGLCAGLTHPTALPLSLLLAWEAALVFNKNKSSRPIAILVAPIMNVIGMVGFMIWRNLAGFPSYQQIQLNIGMRNLHLPWEGLSAVFNSIPALKFDFTYFIPWTNILIFFMIIVIFIWGIRIFPGSMSIFQAGLLVLFLSTSVENYPLLGILRYPLIMFPLYIGIASIGQSKTFRLIKFSVFVTLNLLCSAMFFMWKGGLS